VALNNTYSGAECSIAAALELVGERWTLLIIRQAMLGAHRFDEFQADLGVARNVLDTRLKLLVRHGILDRRPYEKRSERFGYYLTNKGLDLWPTLVALMGWGDTYLPRPGGPPVSLQHRDCGGAITDRRICTACGELVGPRDVWAQHADDVSPDHPLRLRQRRAEEQRRLGVVTAQSAGAPD
jgi:DNA-binding HxlR family transcriptional regulator